MNSYSTNLAKLVLHCNCVPTELDTDQIDDYLYLVQRENPTVSDSYFKFTVYGLRFAFWMLGLNDKHIKLPSNTVISTLSPFWINSPSQS